MAGFFNCFNNFYTGLQYRALDPITGNVLNCTITSVDMERDKSGKTTVKYTVVDNTGNITFTTYQPYIFRDDGSESINELLYDYRNYINGKTVNSGRDILDNQFMTKYDVNETAYVLPHHQMKNGTIENLYSPITYLNVTVIGIKIKLTPSLSTVQYTVRTNEVVPSYDGNGYHIKVKGVHTYMEDELLDSFDEYNENLR